MNSCSTHTRWWGCSERLQLTKKKKEWNNDSFVPWMPQSSITTWGWVHIHVPMPISDSSEIGSLASYMYQPAISVLKLHLQLLSGYLLQSKVTTLLKKDAILSTAHSDIQQFYFYSRNIYYLSKYVGKKYISRRNRNICSLVKFDNIVLEKSKKCVWRTKSQQCPNIS